MKAGKWIEITGARQHNLKNISLRIPKEELVVVTGPSGSGKSSLAFDTLFAEGQRRYMESLSTYARQFLDKHEKPDVDDIKGLSPTIAIEQKNHTKNSRSTVGTATEIYDYLRLTFAKMGAMYDPKTGEVVKKNLVSEVVNQHLRQHANARAYIVFPLDFAAKSKIDDRRRLLGTLLERGFSRILLPAEIKIGREVEARDLQMELQNKKSDLYGKSTKAQQLFVVSDRLSIDEEHRSRFGDALSMAYSEGFGRARVLILDEDSKLRFEGRYSEYPSSNGGEDRYPELSPLLFSFNSPMGACEACKGFGNILTLDPNLVVPNTNLSISQGAIEPLTKPSAKDWLKQLLSFCVEKKISLNLPWSAISEKDRTRIWAGEGKFVGLEGMFNELEESRYKMQVRVFLSRYRSPRTCKVCGGERLRAEARHVRFHDKSIGQLSDLSISDLSKWFSSLKLSAVEKEMGKDIVPQIKARLDFLLRVGLDYLNLNRLAKTLSGGEAQRIALANQLGARLTQTCYVLDEPSIGLHPRDTEKLVGILKDLKALRNSVIVVEHDPDIIREADHLIDLGPEAGEQGGALLYNGASSEFLAKGPAESLTHAYLSNRESVPVPKRRRSDRFKDRGRKVSWLEMTGCRENNLKKTHLKIPHGMLTCVTGVSGSGKSTAIRKTLYPALAKILMQENDEIGAFDKVFGFDGIRSVHLINQDPIGRSPRSNPITFMKSFDEIRSLFAGTFEARKKNYHAGYFSFNVPGGRCETCEGDGYIRIEMLFMEDMFVKCEVCEGKRYKPEILEIKYNGKNIFDVLNLTVVEARKFFASELRLNNNLGILEKVGLGYLRLGQSAITLSGGESQRLKIARELSHSDSTGILYILDEPTTGLHFRDVKVLIRVLNELVERGNTVLVIEHNTDVMKCADWVIDFGPEGGVKGGDIVAEGTPEEIVKKAKGHTWRYLKTALDNSVRANVNDFLEINPA